MDSSAPLPSDTDSTLQGWYRETASDEAVRVRITIEGDTLSLHTLSERLLARWSLDHLQNRAVSLFTESWVVGDSRLPMPNLELENDRDYRAIQALSPNLRPTRARFWRQLGFSVIESGEHTGLPIFLITLATLAVYWLWQTLPLGSCIATHPYGILFLKCLLIDHFIPN